MEKDYPRMRRFWWILFSIIGALWTIYGLFSMVIALIVDPVVRWSMLGVVVVGAVFFVAVEWGPVRRFTVRNAALTYVLGAVMWAGGFYLPFSAASPPPLVMAAGICLMVGGTFVLTIPRLLRHGQP